MDGRKLRPDAHHDARVHRCSAKFAPYPAPREAPEPKRPTTRWRWHPDLLTLMRRPFDSNNDPSSGPSRWISCTKFKFTIEERCTRTKVAGSNLAATSSIVSRKR